MNIYVGTQAEMKGTLLKLDETRLCESPSCFEIFAGPQSHLERAIQLPQWSQRSNVYL